jgi:hypothetical protein
MRWEYGNNSQTQYVIDWLSKCSEQPRESLAAANGHDDDAESNKCQKQFIATMSRVWLLAGGSTEATQYGLSDPNTSGSEANARKSNPTH